jgi:asparagine synthase (glutamine-hydrolysing)
MIQAMNYEPFYSTGLFSDEQLGVYAGWVVHPNSFSDCMPIRSRDGRTTLLFDGEVFNSSQQSATFRSFDASPLAQLYQESGEALFAELNGTFSGIVVSSSDQTVKLFNDRIGFQKMYCIDSSEGLFHFSSEAKSLLQVDPRTREFDREGLAQFLAYGCTFEPKTLYKHISLLPAASVWEFRLNTPIKKRTYFFPSDWQVQTQVKAESFYEEFRETFRKIVPRYFPAPATGMSITGGWDTRMILAALQPAPGEHRSYTFGGFSRETLDVRLGRKIARVAGQPHTVLNLQTDFLSDFATHAEKTVYISDGYSDISLAHELYLTRMAREISPSRVTGNFGSEILRGMSTFKETGLRKEYWNNSGLDVEAVSRQWKREQEANRAVFAIFKEIPWKLTAVSRLAESQLSLRSPFLDNEVLKLACQHPILVGSDSQVAVSFVSRECPQLLSIQTDRGEAGPGGSFRQSLRHVMYAVDFKLDYLLTEGTPDFIPAFSDVLSADYILPWRHKFLEYRRWFRGPLSSYVHDLLGGSNTFVCGLVGRKTIERVVRDNASGVRNELVEITALMTLELAARSLLRGNHKPHTTPLPNLSAELAAETGFSTKADSILRKNKFVC